MIWPHNLAAYYPYPQSLPLWQVAGVVLLLASISIIVFRAVKPKPYLAVGWLWYIGTLVPAIGLVQAGLWPAIADRFVYVPLIGLFIVIAWGVPDLVARWRFREIKLATLSAALISILMATTYLQAGYWTNSITLFEHALDVADNNYIAHHKLGEALEAEGKTDAAIRHYSETLRIRPDFVSTYLNLGVALRGQGKFNKAIDQFSKVLRLKPDYAVAHKELGITLEEQGDFAEAIRHYLKALEIRPDYAKVHNKLGIILAHQGKIEDAIFHYPKSIAI